MTRRDEGPGRVGRAFTLIELLVVISVIALLMGIVLPALGSSREASRRAKCLANLRSIGQGFQMYLKDSKGIFPLVNPLHGSSTNPNDPSLLDVLSEYLDAPAPKRVDPNNTDSPFVVSDPYKCPSDRAGAGANGNQQPVWEKDGCSYEYIPGPFMLVAEVIRVRDPALGVSKAYENGRDWPIAADADEFHKGRANGPKRNAFFFSDMHTDWATEISGIDAGKFFADVQKFGGILPPP